MAKFRYDGEPAYYPSLTHLDENGQPNRGLEVVDGETYDLLEDMPTDGRWSDPAPTSTSPAPAAPDPAPVEAPLSA